MQQAIKYFAIACFLVASLINVVANKPKPDNRVVHVEVLHVPRMDCHVEYSEEMCKLIVTNKPNASKDEIKAIINKWKVSQVRKAIYMSMALYGVETYYDSNAWKPTTISPDPVSTI